MKLLRGIILWLKGYRRNKLNQYGVGWKGDFIHSAWTLDAIVRRRTQ